MQQADFEGIFEAMAGLPVTIRLLDPPLHEFLPPLEEATDERMRERIRVLQEANPMLGMRGCRVGPDLPRDLRDAGARDRARRAGGRRSARARRRSSRSCTRSSASPRSCGGCASSPIATGRRGGRARLPRRHDDRAAARVHARRRDRRARRLLLLRHERPHADGARLLARRRREQVPRALPRGRRARAQPVRDARRGRAWAS